MGERVFIKWINTVEFLLTLDCNTQILPAIFSKDKSDNKRKKKSSDHSDVEVEHIVYTSFRFEASRL